MRKEVLVFFLQSFKLEPEPLEEPLVSGGLLLILKILLVDVTLLEHLLKVLLHGNGISLHVVLLDHLLQIHVNTVASGHEVGVVHVLEERLDLGALGDLGLGHGLGNLPRGTVDTRNKGVAELLVSRSIVEGADNNGLLSSETSIEDKDNLSRLDDSHSISFYSEGVAEGRVSG